MKNFRCNDCESLFDDIEIGSNLFCPLCGGHLEEGVFQEPKESDNYTRYDKESKSKDSRQKPDSFIFSCLSCDKSIRIAFPFKSFRFRCANCGDRYEIISTTNNKDIYLVVPKLNGSSSSNDKPPRKPPMSEEVKNALHIFDLNENTSLATLKVAYRKCMTEYHPDKVSHLGADLKKFAEEKTKEYNTAFDIAKKYFEQ